MDGRWASCKENRKLKRDLATHLYTLWHLVGNSVLPIKGWRGAVIHLDFIKKTCKIGGLYFNVKREYNSLYQLMEGRCVFGGGRSN